MSITATYSVHDNCMIPILLISIPLKISCGEDLRIPDKENRIFCLTSYIENTADYQPPPAKLFR